MTTPSARCFPRDDAEFAGDVATHLGSDGFVPTRDEILGRLRTKYPQVRIVERSALATIGEGPVWYVYRDGRPVPGGDGVGAMRAWSRVEVLTNRSMDLIEWSSDAMRRSEDALAAALGAIRPRPRDADAWRGDQPAPSPRRISISNSGK